MEEKDPQEIAVGKYVRFKYKLWPKGRERVQKWGVVQEIHGVHVLVLWNEIPTPYWTVEWQLTTKREDLFSSTRKQETLTDTFF